MLGYKSFNQAALLVGEYDILRAFDDQPVYLDGLGPAGSWSSSSAW
jgi:hypothetical protein